MGETERGALAESMAASWALRKGWTVAWPNRGQQPLWDLIIEDDFNVLWRAQVKRAYMKNGALVANLYHDGNQRYRPEEIDVFIVVDTDLHQVWWVPLGETQGKSRVVLTTPFMERYRDVDTIS